MAITDRPVVKRLLEAAEDRCECGCGEPAGIYSRTDRRAGYVKGERRRFAPGHGVGRNGLARRNRRQLSKRDAQAMLNEAVKAGRLVVPDSCERCGVTPKDASDGRRQLQAHHHDYARPLEIEWLCVACHTDAHAGEVAGPYEGRRKFKLGFYLPPVLYRAVVERARRDGVSRTSIVEAALRDYLERTDGVH